MIQGCTFGIMEVEQDNMKVSTMSLGTSTPITYVPLVILYKSGHPQAMFTPNEQNPAGALDQLKAFLVQHTTKQQQVAPIASTSKSETSKFSTGRPAPGKNVCYLTFESAYGKPNKQL
jgi:hypothetical protein